MDARHKVTSMLFVAKAELRYLALITEPKELLQIIGKFSLEKERIFPFKEVGSKRLYPVLAVRTYYLDDKKP